MLTVKAPLAGLPASTVLIVDDDKDMLELCSITLGAHGFSVLKAIGSAEAHQICADFPAKIDLILIDVMLYPPSVQLDDSKNALPRVHGDNCCRCYGPSGH